MKVQIICEHCGNIVEIQGKNQSVYAFNKLNDGDMSCDLDIETEVTSDFDDIESNDDIEAEGKLNSIRFTCKNCGSYIELTDLT